MLTQLSFKQLSILMLLAFTGFNCQHPEEDDQIAPMQVLQGPSNAATMNPDKARTAFAKALAKAMVHQELRDFLKKEALQQFDKDYDVFFHAHKNTKVRGNTTLFELLAQYHQSEEQFETVIRSLPKLTIYVPDLLDQSANTWNTQEQIPKVAVVNYAQEQKGAGFLPAFDAQGQEYHLDAFKRPDELVLVVKNNERIEVIKQTKNARFAKPPQWQFYMSDEANQYYFSSASYNPRGQAAARLNGWFDWPDWFDDFEAIIDAAIRKNNPEIAAEENNPNCPREYIYYNTGELDVDMKERLSYFRFRSEEALETAADGWTYDDGWAEGNLELEVTLLLGGNQPASFSSEFFTMSVYAHMAVLAVPGYLDERHPDYLNAKEMYTYYKNKGDLVEFKEGKYVNAQVAGPWIVFGGGNVNWSPHRYGDVVKYIFIEHDDGAEITETKKHEVGFNASIGKKDVWNIGLNGKVSGEITVKYTDKDERLGEAFVYYCQRLGIVAPPITTGAIEFVIQSK